jgi:hypothetical protein
MPRKKKLEGNDLVLYALVKQVLGESGSGPSQNAVLVDFVRSVEDEHEDELDGAGVPR